MNIKLKILNILNNTLNIINSEILNRIILKIFDKLKFRTNLWAFYICKGEINNTSLQESKMIIPNPNEFWADPFVFNYLNKNYIFFENYSYSKKKGKISYGIIQDDKFIFLGDCLEKDKHLSYPFIFQIRNKIFLIPETYESKHLEIYVSKSFPDKWELFKVKFINEEIVDPTIFIDNLNNIWLFLNKKNENDSSFTDLFLYKVEDEKFENFIPHKLNPIISEKKNGRNAGRIFSINDKIFRPSQKNDSIYYGRGIKQLKS